MWLWPVWKFWTFSPRGWVLAIVWNMAELFKIQLGNAAPYFFDVIVQTKGKASEEK
jgi:hypothetical protein